MLLIPYYNNKTLSVSDITVTVTPEDQERAIALVRETKGLRLVTDDAAFKIVRTAAIRLKSMLKEIDDAKAAAKRPLSAVQSAITNLASDISEPVESEHTRLLGLLNGYVAGLEAKRLQEEREKRQKAELEKAELQRKLAEAQRANDILAIEKAQLERELADEVIGTPEPRRGLVPGGRVDHPVSFDCDDVAELIKATGLRFIRWELNIQALQDHVRDFKLKFPDQLPTIPGITITQSISVSVKAQAGRR